MKYDKAFNKLFKKFKNDCYIIEYRRDTDCTDKSYSCIKCAGLGHVITKVYKLPAVIDQNISPESLPNVNETLDFGNYTKESKTAYFNKDSSFDLSPSIGRMVLNILNGEITDTYYVMYLKPMTANNNIVYYVSYLAQVNLNSTDMLKTLEYLVE